MWPGCWNGEHEQDKEFGLNGIRVENYQQSEVIPEKVEKPIGEAEER